jgi:hypothetical protein
MPVKFSDAYKNATQNEIELLEKKLGYPLLDQYKHFLLEHNGGRPTPAEVNYQQPDRNELSSTVIQFFFGIYDQGDIYDLSSNSVEGDGDYMGRMPPHFLPIAIDVFGNLFCISLSGNDIGKIFFWHHESSDFENRDLGIPQVIQMLIGFLTVLMNFLIVYMKIEIFSLR